MKAITVVPGAKNSVQLSDIEPPKPKPNEVRVRVARVGVCGTDRDIISGLYGVPPAGSDFLVLGHESFGSIESAGKDVVGFEPGDLVVPTVRRPCPENCLNCRNGESDMCLTGHYFEHGINRLHGFASELALSDFRYLTKIPQQLSDVAVLLEPTSIVEKAIQQVFAIQRRMRWEPKNVLMLGAGPIGQLVTALLRLRGLEVYTVARRPITDPKAKLIESLGARYVNVGETSIESLDLTFDIIIEGTGNPTVAADALRYLATDGVLCYLGVYPPSEIVLPLGQQLRSMVLGNKLIFGCVNANRSYFETGIHDYMRIKEKFPSFLPSLISSRVKLQDFQKAYEPEQGSIKQVIEFS